MKNQGISSAPKDISWQLTNDLFVKIFIYYLFSNIPIILKASHCYH